ncbi:hypothetical protein [Sulfuriflexus mobilis]|uniref:hypothetical protein n=1 Tax=Sulfuriflexus mobilis TaxID=1811807 RepID=UPI000F832A40|nr:hypothetical protein [Sulfuriflexus mobilis]
MKLAVSIVFLSLALLSSLSYGEDLHSHETKKDISGIESLSPELRELLTKEMLALQNGMMSVIPAYVTGNWSEIENISHKMKNSYILKQSLTDEQVKELHTSLPESFIKLDQEFHYLSGMLNQAAKNKKPELVGFYFSKLSESCVSCHTQYAVHKFPALAPEKMTDMHEH